VKLPSYDVSELRRTIFKTDFANLEEYLQGFIYTTGVMQTADACERVAYEFAEDNFNEGVRYFEVRFAPQLHCSVDDKDNFGIREVLKAVDRGLRRSRDEFNQRLIAEQEAGRCPGEPPYEYGIIVCALRMFFKGMSRYYDALYALHPDEGPDEITSMASVVLVQGAEKARDLDGLPIVGVDIAGAERGNEAVVHQKAFDLAHQLFFHKTVHAGEGFGPESIGQAVKHLHAERIGHGFHIFSKEEVSGKNHTDAARYVDNLVRWISDLRITMEVALTSNVNTMPWLTGEDGFIVEKFAFKKMVESKLSVTLCTDNRLVSNTTTIRELHLAIVNFNLTAKELREIVIAGFKRSFYPGSYVERRAYVRKAMDYYDSLVEQHNVV